MILCWFVSLTGGERLPTVAVHRLPFNRQTKQMTDV